jgi:hypothetical protein
VDERVPLPPQRRGQERKASSSTVATAVMVMEDAPSAEDTAHDPLTVRRVREQRPLCRTPTALGTATLETA